MYYIYKQIMKNEKGTLMVESDVDFVEKIGSLRNVRLNYGVILDEDELDILEGKSREVWMITDQDYDVIGYINLRQYLVVLEDENNIKESFVTDDPKKTVLEILSDGYWRLEFEEDVDYFHPDSVVRAGSFSSVIPDYLLINDEHQEFITLMIFDITRNENTIIEMPNTSWLSKQKLTPKQFAVEFTNKIEQCISDNEVDISIEDIDTEILSNIQQCFTKPYVLMALANYYDALAEKTHRKIKENIHE